MFVSFRKVVFMEFHAIDATDSAALDMPLMFIIYDDAHTNLFKNYLSISYLSVTYSML